MKRLVAIFVVLISFAHSRAEQLPIRTYTTADGLPRDSIQTIVSDPRGYLWFCTSDGLSRFDGYEFVNYGLALCGYAACLKLSCLRKRHVLKPISTIVNNASVNRFG